MEFVKPKKQICVEFATEWVDWGHRQTSVKSTSKISGSVNQSN